MAETGKTGAPCGDKAEARGTRRASLVELFLLFSQLGLSSFGGGVSAWIHRTFVEQRGWLDETEFAAAMGLGRIMPGANVVNLCVLVGERLRGAPGAIAATLGLLIGPSLAVIALATVYHRFAGSNVLHAVLEGAAAAAVGLLIGMGVKSADGVVRPGGEHPAYRRMGAIVILAATFVAIGVLRLPTVATVLILAPVSVALAYFTGTDATSEKNNDAGG